MGPTPCYMLTVAIQSCLNHDSARGDELTISPNLPYASCSVLIFSHPSALQTREKLISHPQVLETKIPIFLTRGLAGVLNRDCLSFPPIRISHISFCLSCLSLLPLCLGYRSLLYCWRSRRLNRKAYTGFYSPFW